MEPTSKRPTCPPEAMNEYGKLRSPSRTFSPINDVNAKTTIKKAIKKSDRLLDPRLPKSASGTVTVVIAYRGNAVLAKRPASS